MSLTRAQKALGRTWRDAQSKALDELNETDPPDYYPLVVMAVIRHMCPKRSGASLAVELREHYKVNPALCDHLDNELPAGTIAFLYSEGRCSHCRQTARSKAGRIVITSERAPLSSTIRSV